ncbi:MAG: hypothetical protein QNJ63_24720 [Calothrix sp. MO_192.B10]|nr:hypothetical protein [Calothrix sp. MO_192.B10]
MLYLRLRLVNLLASVSLKKRDLNISHIAEKSSELDHQESQKSPEYIHRIKQVYSLERQSFM